MTLLIAHREIKSARNTPENSKATGAVIIKVFYQETQRSITDSTLRRIIKNFDFQTKEITSYREKMAFEIIDRIYLNKNTCRFLRQINCTRLMKLKVKTIN